MARASRSSGKKQPDFDPSELEDLIFSPAVGKGVGSHLVTPIPARMATVATSLATTVPRTHDHSRARDMATVVTPEHPPTTGAPTPDLTTVDTFTSATVDKSSADQTTVVTSHIRPAQLWITEHGDLVSAARVKKIRLAQDVINSAEESVYDTLWNAKLVGSDDSSRLVQAGYDYLVKRTRLSRKTIQRIVAKLLEKDFIEVDTRADIYQRAATVYRVFSYKAVLERNTRKGRLHVAKMGPGFAYARPLTAAETGMTTMDMSNMTTQVSDDMATMAPETTVTVVKNDSPTVVKMSPHLLDSKSLDRQTSSSASERVQAALATYGRADDDVTNRLVAACQSYAPDCTEDEIVHFVHEKGTLVQRRDNRIQNPLGFLLTAVPKCFSSPVLTAFRAEKSREVAARAAAQPYGPEDPALTRWRAEQEAALADPSISEQEKHLIRLCLGLNPG